MQTIITRFSPCTDTRGPRYTATSTAGARVMIKVNPTWKGEYRGHVAAVRALQTKIGNLWPTSRMIGGHINQRGDMVWTFMGKDSPRINPKRGAKR